MNFTNDTPVNSKLY